MLSRHKNLPLRRHLLSLLLMLFAAVAPACAATQTISPAAVYVHISQRQQFTSAGATSWTATVGQISTAGLYIAPATLPANTAVTITAKGANGTATARVVLVSGAYQTATPSPVTVALGGKQQFTSAGATGWSAVYGTITSTGLYTAPAVWPPSRGDTITVSGTHGTGTAAVTIPAPTPTIASIGLSKNQIPLGVFAVAVQGTGLSSNTTAAIRGAVQVTSYAAPYLWIYGFFNAPGTATVTLYNGSVASQPYAIQIGVANAKASPAAARRILQQAAFGPTPNDANRVQALGIPLWINEQLNLPKSSSYNSITATWGTMPELFLTNAVYQPDQLRQRVAFALSQTFVTSLEKLSSNVNMKPYQEMLLADAFTNYRTIMQDVTLSAAMGKYLDMANNAKADPTTGAVANENYARELMQLFTLGPGLLNQDGTPQLDANGLPLPTYSQFQITEFARVYTGWTNTPKPGTALAWNGPAGGWGPLVAFPAQHDSGSKQLLNAYVSPAGATPAQDLTNALNNIFNHPNICPFVSRLLIQHLVKSNPSPAYISRVAAVFKNNGSGVRGDMKAVITAILMDPEARANDEGGKDQASDGHLQEPALYLAGMVRAFGGQMTTGNYYHYDMLRMGEDIFSAPSVFNYYAPTYGVAGTGLMGGEFQIYSPDTAVFRANDVSNLFATYSTPIEMDGPGVTVNVAAFVPLGATPATLVNALDFTLTRGVMPAEMKSIITTAVTGETGGNLRRVQRGIYLIMTSGYYNVWH